MDAIARDPRPDPVVAVTGAGSVVLEPGVHTADPTALLRIRKSRKFMGVQDDLAVVAAGRALASAGLAGASLGERAGLYLAVGYIPFEEDDFKPVLDVSVEAGELSMPRFTTEGFRRAHPLLTFRCLPNMPAYHVSTNFDLQGPYFVTYPGPGQLYLALEEALSALAAGRIDIALVGGVAHQRNFLVEHHFRRLAPPVPADRLRDAGGFVVLETLAHAASRGATLRGGLESMSVEYAAFDPLREMPARAETLEASGGLGAPWPVANEIELGPASLPVALAAALCSPGGPSSSVRHALTTRDGIRARSSWSGASNMEGTS